MMMILYQMSIDSHLREICDDDGQGKERRRLDRWRAAEGWMECVRRWNGMESRL